MNLTPIRLSSHNILSRIKDSNQYFLVNLLSGNADVLSQEEAVKIQSLQYPDTNELISKGYLVDPLTESKAYKNEYLKFIDERDQDEIQLFFVPNYSCNFSCSYCYQGEYAPEPKQLTKEIIDAFFKYLKQEFAGRKKYITLFGGEPLLSNDLQKENIEYFIGKANEQNLEICVVTNGYTLTSYMEILKKASIREIQITLDGTKEIHDSRRYLKGKQSTFDRIVEGIDSCLTSHFPVNLRIVVDKENFHNLPELARYAIERGWTKNELFKTQIGRNYELHHCNSTPEKLFNRISLYEELYQLIKKYPFITEFYKPSFSVAKYLSENGELPKSLFDSCPACKTEWAFDYTGTIYSCTATVGKSGEELGSFYPEITKNETLISQWQERDVTSISKCKSCNLQLACGGGCGSVAKNKNGTIISPDCRPVKELLEMGFAHYIVK